MGFFHIFVQQNVDICIARDKCCGLESCLDLVNCLKTDFAWSWTCIYINDLVLDLVSSLNNKKLGREHSRDQQM